MDLKIEILKNEKEGTVTFTPSVNDQTTASFTELLINALPTVIYSITSEIPMLRPATEDERAQNVYVFREGDPGKLENHLYKYRKGLHDAIAAAVNETLSTVFPDVQYIQACAKYQQDFCAEHTEEEIKAYQETVKSLTDSVRENFSEIMESIYGEEPEETRS